MKKILFAAFIGCLFIFSSCASRDDDPSLVLSDFFEAMSEKDLPRARSLATADSKPTLDLIEMALRTSVGENSFFNPEGKKFGEAIIDGNRAIVPVKEQKTGINLEYLLRREEGAWKVAFDKDAFIDMGVEKMRRLRANRDSNVDVLDEIKNIDIDSLKRSFN